MAIVSHRPSRMPPDRVTALVAKGRALIEAGQAKAALAPLREVATLTAGRPPLDLGIALHMTGEIEDAVTVYRAVLSADPRNSRALNSLGAALLRLGDMEEAEAALRHALTLDPRFPEAFNNLGRVARAAGRLAEASRHFDAALAIRPDFAQARWNHATTRLLAGDMPAGWIDFEARWSLPEIGPPQAFPRPAWTGEPLSGRTILLHPEQGLGDTIQFARYAALLAGQGAHVVLGVQPELKRLMASLQGPATIVARGEQLPSFDCHLPLMSVPLRLNQSLHDLSADPYLRTEPAMEARWRARIGTGPGLAVGLIWAGNPMHANDRNRSLCLSQLAPLLAVPDTRFFSLQLGPKRAQTAEVQGIVDLSDGLTDFAETAGALAALDVLVTVDTSSAHLAGAMGRPVWLLLPAEPDWRWFLGRTDSPWYSTMRLFRQPRHGDYATPVAEAASALRRLASMKAAP